MKKKEESDSCKLIKDDNLISLQDKQKLEQKIKDHDEDKLKITRTL